VEVLMRRGWLGLLLLASGCEFLRPPTEVTVEPHLQVHSLLRGGVDTVAVLVERSGAEAGRPQRTPVSGAVVRIEGAGEAVTLREAPEGFLPCAVHYDPNESAGAPPPIGSGCYAATIPGGVRSGRSYTLSVEVPDGGTVAGRTTVPHPPQDIQPAEHARVRMVRDPQGRQDFSEPLTLRWHSPPPAGGAGFQVVATSVFEQGRVAADAGCWVWLADAGGSRQDPAQTGSDSVRIRGNIQGCSAPTAAGQRREVRPDSVAVILRFTAVDSSYATYQRVHRDRGVREESASAGITGAYGLFGSASGVNRRIVFVFADG
jgi:hypothetical protein